MNTKPQLIPNVAAAVLLIVALGDHPYGYYTFLRWAVTIAAGVTAWVGFKSRWPIAAWPFVGLAILFNPLAPVYLPRETWRPIDVGAAVLLLAGVGLRIDRSGHKQHTHPV